MQSVLFTLKRQIDNLEKYKLCHTGSNGTVPEELQKQLTDHLQALTVIENLKTAHNTESVPCSRCESNSGYIGELYYCPVCGKKL